MMTRAPAGVSFFAIGCNPGTAWPVMLSTGMSLSPTSFHST
jgi:hypothetical protein